MVPQLRDLCVEGSGESSSVPSIRFGELPYVVNRRDHLVYFGRVVTGGIGTARSDIFFHESQAFNVLSEFCHEGHKLSR